MVINKRWRLNAPKGIYVGDIDGLYVADLGNHRIVRFSTDGSFEENIGAGILLSPADVAWDETTAQVVVADTGNSRVAVLKEGALTSSVGIADGLTAAPEHVRPAGPKTPGLVYAAEPLAGKIARVRLPTDLPDRAWAEMIAWLDAGNIDRAMEYFSEGQRDFYRDLLRRSTDLHAFAAQASVITMKTCKEGYCEYEFTLSGQRDGQPVTSTHTIMFSKDQLGRWKILQF
jgi:hypothetical protein